MIIKDLVHQILVNSNRSMPFREICRIVKTTRKVSDSAVRMGLSVHPEIMSQRRGREVVYTLLKNFGKYGQE